MTPLLWLLAAAFFIGVLGSMGAFVYSQIIQSQYGAAVAVIVLLSAGGITVIGAALVGAVVKARQPR